MNPALRAAAQLNLADFDLIRTKLVIDHCKWDPQVGDTSVLAAFPLLISGAEWRRLSDYAESLSAELLAAERELLDSPFLLAQLGIPRKLRGGLLAASAGDAAIPRILRFDFHWTTIGWQISEVNADVPGGLCEASAFPALMAAHYREARPAGDPGAAWAGAIADAALSGGRDIALLTAPGFMEDHQVMNYLSGELQRRGFRTHLANPGNLIWRDGVANLNPAFGASSLAAVVRFFQAEWLPGQSRRAGWEKFFLPRRTPVFNPASSMVIESKRFPLTWKHLKTAIPTWKKLLPATVDPREADWRHDVKWLLKSAFCNTGDSVTVRGLVSEESWRSISREVRWNRRGWIAQRRFETLPIESPMGAVFPCIGVYTVAGTAAGIYGRLSRTAIINYEAIDVAVLVKELE